MKPASKLALKEWAIVCRFLREGTGIVLLRKELGPGDREFFLFPVYTGQNELALKPHVWMSWRHEMRAPLDGSAYIRAYADIAEAFLVRSLAPLRAIDREHAFVAGEMERRFEEGGDRGLLVLALRVYRLPRSYKITNLKEYEGGESWVTLPEEISTEGATPVLSDEGFGRRLAALRWTLRSPARVA